LRRRPKIPLPLVDEDIFRCAGVTITASASGRARPELVDDVPRRLRDGAAVFEDEASPRACRDKETISSKTTNFSSIRP